eukprot:5603656-Pleurochrysis_carterae.AAC.1
MALRSVLGFPLQRHVKEGIGKDFGGRGRMTVRAKGGGGSARGSRRKHTQCDAGSGEARRERRAALRNACPQGLSARADAPPPRRASWPPPPRASWPRQAA